MSLPPLAAAKPANACSRAFRPALACMVLTVLCFPIPLFGTALAATFGLAAFLPIIGDRSQPLESRCDALVAAASARDSTDDITAVLVEISMGSVGGIP